MYYVILIHVKRIYITLLLILINNLYTPVTYFNTLSCITYFFTNIQEDLRHTLTPPYADFAPIYSTLDWWNIWKLRTYCHDFKSLTSPEGITNLQPCLIFLTSMTKTTYPIPTLSHVHTLHAQHSKQFKYPTLRKPCTHVHTPTRQPTYSYWYNAMQISINPHAYLSMRTLYYFHVSRTILLVLLITFLIKSLLKSKLVCLCKL